MKMKSKIISVFSFFQVMEPGWNEIDKGKPNYSGKNMSQCHFVAQKSHMYWHGIFFKFQISLLPMYHSTIMSTSQQKHGTLLLRDRSDVRVYTTWCATLHKLFNLILYTNLQWEVTLCDALFRPSIDAATRRSQNPVRTRASAVGGQRLTAWAMARPHIKRQWENQTKKTELRLEGEYQLLCTQDG
jgi:hypothetical protein